MAIIKPTYFELDGGDPINRGLVWACPFYEGGGGIAHTFGLHPVNNNVYTDKGAWHPEGWNSTSTTDEDMASDSFPSADALADGYTFSFLWHGRCDNIGDWTSMNLFGVASATQGEWVRATKSGGELGTTGDGGKVNVALQGNSTGGTGGALIPYGGEFMAVYSSRKNQDQILWVISDLGIESVTKSNWNANPNPGAAADYKIYGDTRGPAHGGAKGVIKQVRFWNRAITEAEVYRLWYEKWAGYATRRFYPIAVTAAEPEPEPPGGFVAQHYYRNFLQGAL